MADENEELKEISGEERLKNFMDLVQNQKNEPWDSRLSDILDAFEDFLTLRPEPPREWQETYAKSGKEFYFLHDLEKKGVDLIEAGGMLNYIFNTRK